MRNDLGFANDVKCVAAASYAAPSFAFPDHVNARRRQDLPARSRFGEGW